MPPDEINSRSVISRLEATILSMVTAIAPGGTLRWMSLDVERVRTSLNRLRAKNLDVVVRHFYEALFSQHPTAMPLFVRDPDVRVTMFKDTLVAIVDHLDDAPWLELTLKDLGRKHVEFH